jgi:hypothetical protein
MKRFLLAGLAAGALVCAAPALAQTIEPVPATPPIVQPEAEPEVTLDEQLGVGVQVQPVPAAPPEVQRAQPADAVAANAGAVCQARVTRLEFGRGAALSLQNRNTIEYAVDAASVCNLERVTLSGAADRRVTSRRIQAVRAALIARGVPQERIVIGENADLAGDQFEVRMTFAGVATADSAARIAATPSGNAAAPAEEASPVT